MPSTSITTTDQSEARAVCGRVSFPHRLTVAHDPRTFAMSLSALTLGTVSAGLLAYSGEVRVETGELETGYEVNVPLDGDLRHDLVDRRHGRASHILRNLHHRHDTICNRRQFIGRRTWATIGYRSPVVHRQ